MQPAAPTISTQSDIAKTMQPHSAQNMYVSAANNSSGNARTNPQNGGIFRPPPATNTPRGASGGARHVHVQQMYPGNIHQSMVLQPAYTQYTPRQPTYPASHLQYAPPPMQYYTPYQYLPTLQQQPPPPHNRSGVTVNTNVNVGSVGPVQSGPQGPLAGPGASSTQLQMLAGTVQPGANTVIGVGAPPSGVGVGVGQVGVAPMVGVIPTNVAPQAVSVQQTNRRRHQHRLQIIDPATKKNILDDLDKTNSNADSDLSDPTPAPPAASATVTTLLDSIPQPEATGIIVSSTAVVQSSDLRTVTNMPYIQDQNSIIVGQTPVVSAMTDAPSVEILPTPQKNKNKKIPIVSPKNESEPPIAVQTTFEVDDAVPRSDAASNTVDETILPTPTDSIARQETQVHQEIEEPAAPEEKVASSSSELQTQSPPPEPFTASVPEELTSKTSTHMHEAALELNSSTSTSSAFAPIEKSCELVAGPESQQTLQVESSHESTPDETDRASMALVEETRQEPVGAKTAITVALKEQPLHDASLGAPSSELLEDTETQEKTLPRVNSEVELEPRADTGDVTPISPTTDECLSLPSLISYNEGQWSPSNPSGKKQYDREQLLQLRDAKASRVQPEVKNSSILPQPNLMMPSFMRGGNNKSRGVQSMVGTIRSGDSSGGVGANYVGKQMSMSGVQGNGGRSSMKGMIHVNLSLNQDVKLNETENAWRPRLHNKSDTADNIVPEVKATQEKDELVRRVRGILNKLTPERFNTLVEEIVKLKIDTPDKMDEVIVLVFEKAIDEPNFSVSYARLCHRLISEVKAHDERMESGTKSNLAHFRNALLDKTEREFTQNVTQSHAKEKKLQPIVDKIKKCQDPNEKAELEALLEEEERKIRRRSGGTVRFIGELFKISMLTGKIIYSCIDTLLNPQSEDMLECLCKLLTTVGAKFELTPVNTKDPSRCYSLEKSIARMQSIASKSDKDGSRVSSRVRFMLQDVIDLRKNKWQSTRNEAPKTMGQIEKEAKNEQLSAQYYSGSLSSTNPNGSQGTGTGGAGSSSKRDDRGSARFGGDARTSGGYGGSHSQRGESGNMRHQQQNVGNVGVTGHANGNDDNTWHVQTSKGSRSQAVDSNKLEGLTLQLNQNLDTKKMGGVSQFIWNNSSRSSSAATTTPSNSFAVLSSLMDKSSSGDRDRDRDRSGPRNKGSYNKGSMERDRYGGDRGIHSRTGSSQGSRENSSSRVGQQSRGLINSSMQKSASHSKYTQQTPPPVRLSSKGQGASIGGGLYRGSEQQQSSSTTGGNGSTSKIVAPPAVFIDPRDNDLKIIKSVVSEMIELAAANKIVTPSVVACIKRIPESQRCGFVYYILTDYLHLANVGKQYRRYLAIAVSHLIQQNHMSVDHFRLAYKEFSEIAGELIVDIPDLWLYILQFAGPLIVKKILTVADLWNKDLKDSSTPNLGKKFLKAYLTYCTREVGPNFTRQMWKQFNMLWSDFMPENEVADFIESNRLEYVENDSKQPVIEQRESTEKHVKNVIEHIEHLLKEGATADCIIDYSNGNIVTADKLFIRGLTETLSNFAIVYKDTSYKLETEIFQKFCIPVFQRYIDSREEQQLECLYAVQLLVHSLEHPRGLLSELFAELYDGYVIQKESLCKWRDSKDQSAGKGVAVKSLNHFFNSLFNDEAN
ncbi:eukaryotic translation initiation factor 4 gamma 3 isoform X2 [Drosophila willistoni]|uniref:eukaryotic translation initiation factor 4 gamma 3 isoform X2 n=1 Tax=Drosophila willistoni TaxID=7260 RepID=UPI000C26C984|nr:eukaryotic translation initiation factor 4 gamma 3 isoform X2 [Drosophila willistoni]